MKRKMILLVVALLFSISCCPCLFQSVLAPAGTAEACSHLQVVTTIPLETTLDRSATPHTPDVWLAMINRAKHSLDFAQFYLSSQENEPLEPVLAAVVKAANRGIEVRILTDAAMADIYPQPLRRLEQVKNIRVVRFDWQPLKRGRHHGKYFIVDDREAFIGSPNFDWRALKHIHETGLHIECTPLVRALKRIFELDWAYNTGNAAAYDHLAAEPPLTFGGQIYLVSSPADLNPPGVDSALDTLIRLIDGAGESITIQLLDYQVYHREGGGKFTLIDDALRRAAARGVHIRMLISHWNSRQPGIRGLQELVTVPGIDIKMVTIPEYSAGFIPYARVIHSKVMRIDDDLSWVGTSNWGRDYFFNSRNIEVVCRFPQVARPLDLLFEDLWTSPYAQPLDPTKNYPPPKTH